MEYKLSEIIKYLELDSCEKDHIIDGIHTLSEAGPTELSFFNSAKYLDQLGETKAAAILIEEKYVEHLPAGTIALITDEPYLKLALVSKLFAHKLETKGDTPKVGENCDIDESVRFGKNVTVEDNVTIFAGCYIGDNVHIGSGTLLYANVTLYHGCNIGKSCIIHSGTVIGSDGYGFAHTKLGEHVKIYQNGNVVIEDDVEIGANCTIDRAVFGTTFVRRGTKIDNLIQIAHNCDVGEHCLFASQVGLSGSSQLGRNVIMGGQSATTGHLKIGDFATLSGRCVATKNLEGGKTYAGFPAIDHKLWLRLQAKIAGLVKRKKS